MICPGRFLNNRNINICSHFFNNVFHQWKVPSMVNSSYIRFTQLPVRSLICPCAVLGSSLIDVEALEGNFK